MEYIYLESKRLYVYTKEPKRGVQMKSAICFRKYTTLYPTTPRHMLIINNEPILSHISTCVLIYLISSILILEMLKAKEENVANT